MDAFGHLPGLGTQCVYLLRDPDTDDIRYVGRTGNARSRARHHAPKNPGDSNLRCRQWLAKLARQGKTARFELVACIQGPMSALAIKGAEAAITARFLKAGHDLLNSSIYINGKVERLPQ